MFKKMVKQINKTLIIQYNYKQNKIIKIETEKLMVKQVK